MIGGIRTVAAGNTIMILAQMEAVVATCRRMSCPAGAVGRTTKAKSHFDRYSDVRVGAWDQGVWMRYSGEFLLEAK